MNDSNRNNNEVEYCSKVIYCFQTKHRFKKNTRFSQRGPVTRYYPRPTMFSSPTMHHNYILRIYLKNYSIITPTFYMAIIMPYNYDN